MSWPLASLLVVGLVLAVGWLAYERARPSARMVAVIDASNSSSIPATACLKLFIVRTSPTSAGPWVPMCAKNGFLQRELNARLS